MTPIQVLMIDDDQDDFFLVNEIVMEIPNRPIKLTRAKSYSEAAALLKRQMFEAILLDYCLGPMTGLEVYSEIRKSGVQSPIIFLTGVNDRDVDLKAMRVGASDFLVKREITAPLLERTIRYAINTFKTMRELADRKSKMEKLFNATFEGILVHDSAGLVTDANRTAQVMLDLPMNKIIGQSLFELIKPHEEEKFKETITCADGKSVEFQLKGEDTESWIGFATKPYSDFERPLFLTAFWDLTERKALEKRTLEQERLSTVGFLASGLAHDVGTPLSVIRGHAELLGLGLGKNNLKQQDGIRIIISQIDRISKLVKSLLNIARKTQAGQTELLRVEKVLPEVEQLMSYEFRRKGITFESSVESSDIVCVDPDGFHQVLINLLVNSTHAIEKAIGNGKTGPHKVKVCTATSSGNTVISITDTGCGILKSDLPNIFKPFFTTKEKAGTGLGLSMTDELVRSWGGTIGVESEEGVGTTFKISLPRHSQSAITH